MSKIFTLHTSLTETTRVNRILNFFSAAEVVNERRMLFSRADTFPDQNEGIDKLLGSLESVIPNGYGLGWSGDKSARSDYIAMRRSHFVSSWSLQNESAAMWSMHSEDLCSVKIFTRISKLTAIVENFIHKYGYAQLNRADKGSHVVVVKEAKIAPVEYVSLVELSRQVTNRLAARNRLAASYHRRGLEFPALLVTNPRFLDREKFRQIEELRRAFNIKDASFGHEAEVQVAITLGEEICSERILKEQAFLNPRHPEHMFANNILSNFGPVRTKILPKHEFIDCPDEFIEAVSIDPRCPSYKADFMRRWFEEHNIKVIDSSCLGYIF